MKKLYTLISFCAIAGWGFSQAEIRLAEGTPPVGVGDDISGTTYEKIVTEDALYMMTFQVTNTSGSAKQWNMMRYRVTTPPAGWTDGLCWGPSPDPGMDGQCYPAAAMNTNPWTNPHTMDIDTYGNIVVDVHTEGPGCATYRYIIMEGTTRVDSIDIEVCSTLSVDEEEEIAGMTAYPNPANGQLTVATTGMDGNYEIRVTDVLGKVVYNETAFGAKKNIDVSEFKNGVYLVTVLDKGAVIQTRRVVVKH